MLTYGFTSSLTFVLDCFMVLRSISFAQHGVPSRLIGWWCVRKKNFGVFKWFEALVILKDSWRDLNVRLAKGGEWIPRLTRWVGADPNEITRIACVCGYIWVELWNDVDLKECQLGECAFAWMSWLRSDWNWMRLRFTMLDHWLKLQHGA